MADKVLRAPFPWFGGKSRAARLIWQALGDVPNYVEPFAGSLACLLARPGLPRIETVNDLDAFICNFWRAVAAAPDEVAHHADWPVNEADLHARHLWLVQYALNGRLREVLMSDPEAYDAKVAGWWVWGICQWIGGGWCKLPNDGAAISKRRPELFSPKGLNSQGTNAPKLSHQVPDISGNDGAAGRGVLASAKTPRIIDWIQALSRRLRSVRVCCGDWNRVMGPSPTTSIGLTGVLLDPPYADTANRAANLYAEDSLQVAHDVRAWAIEHGEDPLFRIVLCGYEGEHDMPASWRVIKWSGGGGYGGGKSRHRERLWLSPHCIKGDMGPLFGGT